MAWQSTADRHVLLGVSHPSGDPGFHRTFEVNATYSASNGGWTARVAEKNANDQLGAWSRRLADGEMTRIFTTARACLGSAVASIIAMVEREANGQD